MLKILSFTKRRYSLSGPRGNEPGPNVPIWMLAPIGAYIIYKTTNPPPSENSFITSRIFS